MGSYDSGVSRYVVGVAEVKAYFPVDRRGNLDFNCDQCRFYIGRRCALTNEISNYPTRGPGENCPLVLEEGDTP